MSAVEANYGTAAEQLIGGSTGKQQRDGFSIEAVGSLAATPWLTIQLIAQYFINPDAYALPAQPRPRNGFAFGLSTIIPLGRLLGTSEMPF